MARLCPQPAHISAARQRRQGRGCESELTSKQHVCKTPQLVRVAPVLGLQCARAQPATTGSNARHPYMLAAHHRLRCLGRMEAGCLCRHTELRDTVTTGALQNPRV